MEELKELIFTIIDETDEPKCYSLLQNQEIWNQEYYIVYTEHVPGLMSYYPQKKFTTLFESSSIKEILKHLVSCELTYNDVLFLDKIRFEDYALITGYFQKFTTLGSVVKNCLSDSEYSKKTKGIASDLTEKIENVSEGTTLSITKFEKFILILTKSFDDLSKKCDEKKIELIIE